MLFTLMIWMVSCNPGADKQPIHGYLNREGVQLYYEIHGKGAPLLLLHGNGGGLRSLDAQIEQCSRHYQVIAMDCRGRGKSQMGKDSLTYDQMAEDATALLHRLKLDSVYVAGYSDGGIVGLLMAMNHPGMVKKLAVFGANLQSDSNAIYPKVRNEMMQEKNLVEGLIRRGDSSQNNLIRKWRLRLMLYQPHITAEELASIQIPVLVMSTDRDVIKPEHTLKICKALPKSNLCFFPGETHKMPKHNPELFNRTLLHFFESDFIADDARY